MKSSKNNSKVSINNLRKETASEMANNQRTYRSGFLRELNKNFPLFLMALPGVVLLIAFSYLPLFGLIIAFKDVHYDVGILKSPWVGLKNFEFLFKTPDAFIITRNTLLYNFAFIVFGNLAAIATAVALSEMRSRFMAKFYQSVMFLPYFFVLGCCCVYGICIFEYRLRDFKYNGSSKVGFTTNCMVF